MRQKLEQFLLAHEISAVGARSWLNLITSSNTLWTVLHRTVLSSACDLLCKELNAVSGLAALAQS